MNLEKIKVRGAIIFPWQANIAMTLLDELKNANFEYDSLHEISNRAAKNFLDLLIRQKETITAINAEKKDFSEAIQNEMEKLNKKA